MSSQSGSRRGFLAGAGFLAAELAAQDGGAKLTAGQIVERIQKNVGVSWRTETVDKIVAGTAQTPVRGIATTMMSTFDVLQRAAAKGRNFIITHEPTFYNHQDTTDQFASDPTYQAKAEFIRKHEIAVFRFHDHWHAMRPDGIATGMIQELGWEKNVDPQNPRQLRFSGTPLAKFAQEMQKKLGARTIRVIGDPNLLVKTVRAGWGYAGNPPGMAALSSQDVDVYICGETREWELIPYAQDVITSGKKKGLIVLGHVASEQGGMKYCATWLKSFVTEVPIDFVPAAEPFWSPGKPVA